MTSQKALHLLIVHAVQRCIVFSAAVVPVLAAHAVTIETVLVDNPGNSGDTEIMRQDGTTGYGTVPYTYRIGKYEVTNGQYAESLNAVDRAGENTLFLYSDFMAISLAGGIDLDADAQAGSKYIVTADTEHKPVNFVTWYDAIRFVNWLHNGQGSGDTETGAYTLGPLQREAVPINGNSITRNPGAIWFLPTENEWYKAAYHKNDGTTGNFWDYPTASNTAPTADRPPGGVNSANYNNSVGAATDVGAYLLSQSSYGTFDQAGNFSEWNETLLERDNDFFRGQRGGNFRSNTTRLLAAANRPYVACDGPNPVCSSRSKTFRVGRVPEPGTLPLVAMALAIAALRGCRCSACGMPNRCS